MTSTVCLYSANYLPSYGGVEQFTRNAAIALTEAGFTTKIITNNVYDLAEEEETEEGITIYRLPCFAPISGRLPIPKKNQDFRRLFDKITKTPTDFIVINTRFYPHTFLGVQHAESAGIRPIVIDHGSAYLTFGNPAIDIVVKAYEHAITTKLKHHDVDFYGVSEASVEWLKTFGIEGLGVINNSIDADEYLAQASKRNFKSKLESKNCFLISFTGRLIPEKGVRCLLEAARLLSDDPQIQIALAGDGPLKQELTDHNPGNIHLLGRLDANDIAALLKQSDCFCLPTRSEGFSTSLLEAAACYTTPVITDVGGVPEMIPSPDYGVILESQGPRAIADAIRQLKANPERNAILANNIGKRAREKFSWQATAEKIITACERANGRSGRATSL